jgi:hypothetical protein
VHLGDIETGLEYVRRGLEREAAVGDAVVEPLIEAWAARAFTRAGRDAEGIELLEGVRETPGMLSRYHLRHDPEWDPLRDHPEFQELLGAEG